MQKIMIITTGAVETNAFVTEGPKEETRTFPIRLIPFMCPQVVFFFGLLRLPSASSPLLISKCVASNRWCVSLAPSLLKFFVGFSTQNTTQRVTYFPIPH
jgi:hypothetical protein